MKHHTSLMSYHVNNPPDHPRNILRHSSTDTQVQSSISSLLHSNERQHHDICPARGSAHHTWVVLSDKVIHAWTRVPASVTSGEIGRASVLIIDL